MISRIEGQLIVVADGRAELRAGTICYQVLIPACDEPALAAMTGQTVELHTLHFMESQGQGSAFIPRLIGFSAPEDRAFFELFTTVKGLGNRKALRALQMPFPAVADAIAGKDVGLLTTLPEIGKRTAETIVAELHGKVDRFVEAKPRGDGAATDADAGLVHDAVAVLTQLGEPNLAARQLVERAARADPTIATADALVAAAFRLKEIR